MFQLEKFNDISSNHIPLHQQESMPTILNLGWRISPTSNRMEVYNLNHTEFYHAQKKWFHSMRMIRAKSKALTKLLFFNLCQNIKPKRDEETDDEYSKVNDNFIFYPVISHPIKSHCITSIRNQCQKEI